MSQTWSIIEPDSVKNIWTPSKVKEPEYEGEYLVTLRKSGNNNSRWTSSGYYRLFLKEWDVHYDGETMRSYGYEVVAWAELPDHYYD